MVQYYIALRRQLQLLLALADPSLDLVLAIAITTQLLYCIERLHRSPLSMSGPLNKINNVNMSTAYNL